MARYDGGKGRIMLSTTGAGVAVTAVSMSSWSLNKATDKREVTAFGDTNKVYVLSLPDLTGSLSGWFDDTDDSLFDAAESADGGKLYLYPSTDALTIYHYGPAFLDASIEVSATAAVSISGSFVARGAWGRKP